MSSYSSPYLIFLGDAVDPASAKTAFGLKEWVPELCLAQWRLDGASVSLGIQELNPAEAVKKGARSLIVGIANAGGEIPNSWIPALTEAAYAGLDLISGMHRRLSDIPSIKGAAEASGIRLHDVRHYDLPLKTGTGACRSGKRLLTVGTDCNLGKKYTALAITREMARRRVDVEFRATGQTGIMIAGEGIPIDAVVSDFISGAAEAISPANHENHWDVIEGQGSLYHPAYSGVTLGLLHGSQPDALVMCHDPVRKRMRNVDVPMPDVSQAISVYLTLAKLRNPAVRFVGVSLNTSALNERERKSIIEQLTESTALPVVDPLITGVGLIVDALEVDQ